MKNWRKRLQDVCAQNVSIIFMFIRCLTSELSNGFHETLFQICREGGLLRISLEYSARTAKKDQVCQQQKGYEQEHRFISKTITFMCRGTCKEVITTNDTYKHTSV
jgi:hypothetical protein